jgi:hypothetical protein
LKKLLGKNDIEDALKNLDTLTMEEARMAIVETLKVTNRVDDKVDKVDNKVDKMDNKVDRVDDTVNMVDFKVDKVDNKVNRVDDTVNRVDDKVTVLIDGGQNVYLVIHSFLNPDHTYDSKRAIRKHRFTRETAKVAFSSGSLHKS